MFDSLHRWQLGFSFVHMVRFVVHAEHLAFDLGGLWVGAGIATRVEVFGD
jgi:hypothetical protein